MKLTIQKILICALSLIVSIAACVCGMYMTILANMIMGYRLLFCLFFILNPVLVIFMIRFMFRKPVPKEETVGAAEPEKKKKWGWSSKKDESQSAAAETVQDEEPEEATVGSSDTAYTGSTYGNSGSTYSSSGGTYGSSGSTYSNSGGTYSSSGSTYGNSGSTYGNTGYIMPDDEGNADVSASVSGGSEIQSGTSSFAGELDDDIDFADPVTEKAAGSVTEDSVAKFKKISLKRKKRADE